MKMVFSKNAIVAQGPIVHVPQESRSMPLSTSIQPVSRTFLQQGMLGRLMGSTKCNSCGK